jgi:hypothetical protein
MNRSANRRDSAPDRVVSPGAPYIETKANLQIGHVSHALGQSGKDLPTLINSKADDQHPPHGAREKLSEYDASVAAMPVTSGSLLTSSIAPASLGLARRSREEGRVGSR